MLKLLKRVFSSAQVVANESVPPRASTGDALGDVDPDYQARGNALLAAGKFEDAAACYREAIAATPTRLEYFVNLGYVLTELKQTSEASRVLQQAVAIDPVNVDAQYMLAKLARDNGMLDEAIESFKQVLALKPDFETAYLDLCGVLDQCGRIDEARSVMETGISRFPNIARFHYILGTLHAKAKSHSEAIICFQKAISFQPDYANLHFHLALEMYAQGQLEEVVAHLQKAIAFKPDYLEAISNLGTALLDLNRLDEAIATYQRALQIDPNNAESHFNQSLCLLKRGNFESGFQEYEWRWKDKRFQKALRHFTQPLWLGKESIENKTILLHAEQGLGDTIQFCRYAELLAKRGATVLLQVPKVLHSLLLDLNGVNRLLEMDEQLPRFDYHCPLLSLPLAFGTIPSSTPCCIPYLNALPELTAEIQEKMGTDKAFKIGICWKGNANYPRDTERSPGVAPFERLIAQFRGTGAKFYTLLPDSRDLMIRIGGEDLGRELDSDTAPFAETAALISNLDLVLTCDTSIGHIAGALGKPVWIVLPFSPDWRWIATREDSPWYPNTRLFHQVARGDWEELFNRVVGRLNKVLTASSETIWPLPKSTRLSAPTDLRDKK